MVINFDKVLGFHAKALNLRADRAEVIANNLANVDTPGFKARDLDFKNAMAQYAGDTISLAGDNKNHITIQNDPFGVLGLKYRQNNESGLDGNTVDKDVETVAYAKNATEYQASLTFINGAISGLRSAIRGE
jgi:flagellar basal-body rod protein FlgB